MKNRVFAVFVKAAVTAAVVSLILLACVKGYFFGRAVFDEKRGTDENPLSYTIVIEEGESVLRAADELKDAGLIESKWVFAVQKIFYGSRLLPGTYTLDSNMTGKDILDIFSGAAMDAEDGT